MDLLETMGAVQTQAAATISEAAPELTIDHVVVIAFMRDEQFNYQMIGRPDVDRLTPEDRVLIAGKMREYAEEVETS